jgi:ComEC/Rec2-related protein
LLSIVLGIIFQALFDLPLLYYIPLIVIGAVLAAWKHHFLCIAVFAMAAVNLECHDLPNMALPERDMEYSGIVLGEECYEHYTRLTIDVDRIVLAADTMRCAFPVEYYVREQGHFLGRRITVRGRTREAKRISRSALLTGRIVGSIAREHVFGVVFSPIREYIDRLLRNLLDSDQHRIASGLILGGSGRLSRELKTAFSRAGTLHILAVSGLHVGFVGAFFGFVLLFTPFGYRVKFIIVICGLCMYAGVTGFRPSVCRATIMAFLFGLAVVSQRNVGSMHIVNVTAITFLVVKPTLLFNVGAQLSFAAVYGIIYMYPILDGSVIRKFHKRFLRTLLRMMAVSLSAQLFVAPLLVYYFNRLPIYSVVANLLVVPLASSIIFMLFLCFSTGWVSLFVARMTALPVGVLIDVLKALATFFAGLPFSVVKINITPLVTFPLYLLAWKRIRKPVLWSVMIIVLLMSFLRSVDCLTLYTSSRGILVMMPDETKIYLTNRLSSTQNTFLQKHAVDTLDYLVADCRVVPVKRGFIQWPEELQFLTFRYGDLQISVHERLQIKYRHCTMKYPRSYVGENIDDEEIICVLSNGNACYSVGSSRFNTILEQMLFDLRVAFARLRLLF